MRKRRPKIRPPKGVKRSKPKIQKVKTTMADGFDDLPPKVSINRHIEATRSRSSGFRLDKRFPVAEIFPSLPASSVKALDVMLPLGTVEAALFLKNNHGIPITNAIVAVSHRARKNHPAFFKRQW